MFTVVDFRLGREYDYELDKIMIARRLKDAKKAARGIFKFHSDNPGEIPHHVVVIDSDTSKIAFEMPTAFSKYICIWDAYHEAASKAHEERKEGLIEMTEGLIEMTEGA